MDNMLHLGIKRGALLSLMFIALYIGVFVPITMGDIIQPPQSVAEIPALIIHNFQEWLVSIISNGIIYFLPFLMIAMIWLPVWHWHSNLTADKATVNYNKALRNITTMMLLMAILFVMRVLLLLLAVWTGDDIYWNDNVDIITLCAILGLYALFVMAQSLRNRYFSKQA